MSHTGGSVDASRVVLKSLDLLQRLVNMDSPSVQPDYVRAVQKVLRTEYAELGLTTYWHEVEAQSARSVLVAELPGNGRNRVSLLGHADTVFPVGVADARPYRVENGRAHGPGVSDMKGGLALMWATIAYLKSAVGESTRPDIRVVVTPDEEIGTPYSKAAIRKLLADSIAVLNYEPGRPDGSVVTARRGSAHLTLRVHGTSSHSGADFNSGRSAIVSLAQIIVALHGLNEPAADWSLNIGTVSGGTATNVVPDFAEASVHLAFSTEADGRRLLDRARSLVFENRIPDTKAELVGDLSFLPMPDSPGNRALYELFSAHCTYAGQPVKAEHALGAADAGIPASMGIPTLCGVGPVGGKWHSPDEYMEIDGFENRMKACVMTIVGLVG